MDHSALAVSLFHRHAEGYREKFADLTLYNDSYRRFSELLRPGRARVLDVACGPGNVSRYLMAQRPDLDLLGIDLAPRMVELAREAVPSAQFAVHDSRKLADLGRQFDGIICAFGLPYISRSEGLAFMRAAFEALESNAVFYLSTMLGRNEDSGLQTSATGDQVYVTYYSEPEVIRGLEEAGFSIVHRQHLQSPSAASKVTTDLIVIASKQ